MPAASTVDLTNCDREPIHIPGSIQPHGCMIVCNPSASRVLRHSANAPEMLSAPGDVNGRELADVIGASAAHLVRNSLTLTGDASRPALSFAVEVGGRLFDMAVHTHAANAIIEFEPSSVEARQPLELARMLIGRIRGLDEVGRLVQDSARLVKAVTGYDRVMVYHLERDGSGRVVAEAKRPDLESFFGQYFPASDIPQQARALYLRNTIRVISDASGERVPLAPAIDASGEPLDLSFAHLRSVSPIHCEYLRNMGVAASMSISVVVGGELWGLIACHHYTPRVLPMAERSAAEMFGEFFSLHLEALKQRGKLDAATKARQALDGVLRLASHHADLGEALRESLDDIRQLMPCDGVGLWFGGAWLSIGAAPPATFAPPLAQFVGGVAEGRVFATHALGQLLPEAEEDCPSVAGMLAVPLSQRPRDYLFFFRKEIVQTLDWAGNPEKVYATGPLGDRLTPRKSFAIWKETVRGQSRPWSDDDRQIAEAARSALVEIALRHNELLADERSKADLRQRMLNEELNHRVKNILAIIKSLVGHPAKDGRSIADYVASLKGRIQALAYAHDQIVRGDGGGRLSDLVAAELTPYRDPGATVETSGPEFWLDARAFSVIALVLHELSTNAAKYGALSARGGRLGVTWTATSAGDCEILWRESGGPRVSPPTRQGFGTVLVDRSIPYDLGGESAVEYPPSGVEARLLIPAKHVALVDSRVRGADIAEPVAEPQPAAPLGDIRLLLVEDQMLIAMDVEAMLAASGMTNVSTSGSAADALRHLMQFAPDAAVLDVNLGDGTSIAVAEELVRRNIPFVFATGYGDRSMIPEVFSDIPVVRKPYDAQALIRGLEQAIDAQA
ncbi:HWE histidine kinase domain-containing protein [Methylopila turkensis]|uniref:histidine kinase n=1 Tax=Methylopila turkensis TaxID=1437816 RepID=A0A9W6JNC6_9HYPH|nr:HWE histidine kinase domain-containing protein [Methylopila turkensis]GLK78638.1 signal transduction histidine kinase [Methylopila turkensis]